MKLFLKPLRFAIPLLTFFGMAGSSSAQYCTPTYQTGTGNGYYITEVRLDSLADSNGASSSPYFVYNTSKTTTLLMGKTYTITMAAGSTGSGFGTSVDIAVFIDLNADQDFADAGERIGQLGNFGAAPNTQSITFTLPCTAKAGKTRLRVRLGVNRNNMDPCAQFNNGEAQDYNVTLDKNLYKVSYTEASQANTLNIAKGSKKQEIIGMKMFVSGCPDTLTATDFSINSTGTSDTDEIANAYIYYTGKSPYFDTTKLFGTAAATGSQMTISGTQDLIGDTNYFWTAYDVTAGATLGNFMDAGWNSATVDGANFSPGTANPTGNRKIDTLAVVTAITSTQMDSTPVNSGTINNVIMGVEITVSNGAALNLGQLKFTTTGTTTAGDLTLAKVFFTGGNNWFDTTYLFGATANPSGTFTVNGNLQLSPGTSYLWLAYNLSNGATVDNVIDATMTDATINGTTYTPTLGTHTASRLIMGNYCNPVHANCGNSFIQSFSCGLLSNTNSGCSNYSGPAYFNYPITYFNATFNKGNTYAATVVNSGQSQTFSMWIDYNHSGTFDAGEWTQLHTGGNLAASASITKLVTIPCSAKSGWTKMRIRSRQSGGGPAPNGSGDACTQFGSGESEDYIIYIDNKTFPYVDAATATTLDVAPGWANQQIIRMPVMASNCNGNPTVTRFNLKSTGTTDTADLKAARIYYTGTSRTFATTTTFGMLSKPGASYAVTGSQVLQNDTNWFWLVYDIDSNAKSGNFVDAEFVDFVAGGTNYASWTQAPTGNRKIASLMTFNNAVTATASNNNVWSPSITNAIVKVTVNMSNGAAVNLTSITFSTNGSTKPSTDIRNGKLWYTTNSNTFDTTYLKFGNTVAAPNGNFSFTGTLSLIPGNNIFWLTYDIPATATANDSVDAECLHMTIDGISDTPTVTAPAGKRVIQNIYCTPSHTQSCNNAPSAIGKVVFNTLSNKTGCTSITANKYNVYPATGSTTTTVFRGSAYKLKVTTDSLSGGTQILAAWIDMDASGTLDNSEFISINTSIGANSTDSVTIYFPCSIPLGKTLMRVRSRATGFGGGITAGDACTQFGSGESEDYTITIANNPSTGWLGANKLACSGTAVTLNPGNGFVKWKWSTGDTTATIDVTQQGKYYVTATTSGGCVGTDTVTVDTSAITLDLGSDIDVCNGQNAQIFACNCYSKFLWNTGDTSFLTTATNAGDYILTVWNAKGCKTSDTIAVNWVYASANLGADKNICPGGNVTLDAGANSNSYKWSTGANTQTINVNTAGTYTVETVDPNNSCSGFDTVEVFIRPAMVSLGNDTTFCEGGSVTLDAGSSNIAYTWSTGASSQTIAATTTANYKVDVTNTYGCTATDSIMVTVSPKPVIKLGNDTTICQGNNLLLDAGFGNTTYQWNTGATTQMITVNTKAIYSVYCVNPAGCTNRDTITVNVSSASCNLGPDKQWCEGHPDTIRANPGYAFYNWSNGETKSFLIPTTQGMYGCTVTNSANCSASDSIFISVFPKAVATFGTTYLTIDKVQFTPTNTTQTSYFWDLGDGNTSTKISPLYVYTTLGVYKAKLIVTTINGCKDSSSITIYANSIADVKSGIKMEVYPNPFGNDATLLIGLDRGGMGSIDLYDQVGKHISNLHTGNMNAGQSSLTLPANLPAGVYHIRVNINGNVNSIRAVKLNN